MNRSLNRSLRHLVLALSIVGSITAASGIADAATKLTIKDTGKHSRPRQLDIVANGGIVGYSHIGLGGWFGIPVLPDGLIEPLNDALFVEFGGFIEHYSWSSFCDYAWNRITPMGGARWNFYLTPEWTVFATAKAGYGIGFGDSVECGGFYNYSDSSDVAYTEIAVDMGVGAYWNLSEKLQARFEIGYFGAVVGIGMPL